MKIRLAILLVLICLVVAPLPVAQAAESDHLVAVDQPFRCAYVDSGIDSVGANTTLNGHYSWSFHIYNNSEQTVDPTIGVESSSHPEWFPDGTFPASWSRETPLGPWEQWWDSRLRSTDPITFSLGYDCSRTMVPPEIPPGGGVQEVTVVVKPIAERYASGFMRVEVDGNVADGTSPQPDPEEVGQGQVVWTVREVQRDTEYIFTVQLQVENPSAVASLVHKPRVHVFVQSAKFFDLEPSTSTTINDGILGGDITYSVAAGDWQWRRIIADCWMVEYEKLSQRVAIEDAIADGVAWLAEQQKEDGSWGTEYPLAKTALAVLKLESYATEQGISPFHPDYKYRTQVENGLNYIFANAYITNIRPQPAGDPDGDGDGIGVYFYIPGEGNDGAGLPIYNTSIAMMAIAASNAPKGVVNVPGSPVDGWFYYQVLQDAVDYMAWAQTDSGFGKGGWNYTPMDNAPGRSDQSNSGWAALGLADAEDFGIPIPGFVKTELDVWIDYIQNDVDGDPEDGGADYDGPVGQHELWVNILKTGSLLQQMAFVGDTEDTQRVKDAISYLVRHWNENFDPGWRGPWTSCYHTMYTTMKGLEAFEIAAIESIDWFQDFADALLSEQSADGSWPPSRWATGERILSTEWALLTLEKVAPPPPSNPPEAVAVVPYVAEVGTPVEFDGSGSTDSDGEITAYYWIFGDGNTGVGASVPHTYETTGVYTAQLTVTDDTGAQDTCSAMVVVYDPAAGFATGGGWFIPGGNTSYNDDLLPNIDGTSPANFGFVVKYKPGATTLGGQLEFQYRQGDFNLHSSGMDWLFIVNKNWAKFKGIATIKGFEGFWPFRVDARDGDFGGGSQPDRFIIKVYEPGVDPDQSDPIYKASGDLEGGSIVIHAKAYEVTRVLRLQTSFPSGHPFMTPLKNFAQAVEQNTSGSVRIELYPRDALVPNIELAKAVKWGDVEMGLIVHGWLAPLSPVMWAGGLPFLYNDDDGLMDAVSAGIGDLMSQELKAHNITAIDWTNLAFAHLFHRTKMLALPDDVVISDKIRAVGIQEAAVIEWGGTRVLMPPDQVYMALKDGLIGGAAFPLHAYDAYKLYDVARYFCVDYAFANLAGLCINSDVWKSLDAETQQTITTAAGAYVDEMLATVKSVDAAALDTIKDYGVEVYTLTPEERAVWRQASEPVWYDWADGVGDVGQKIIDIALQYNPLPPPPTP